MVGKIVVWADDATRVYGSISARGGAQSGNGGFVETSGKNYLEITRAVDAGALNGLAGMWLLDPLNVTVVATNTNPSLDGQGPNFSPTQDSSTITNTVINTALDAGTSVSIDTGSTGTQAGDITINADITKSAGTDATLTLNAANDITINNTVTSTSGELTLC